MICLEIYRNGKKVYTAGISQTLPGEVPTWPLAGCPMLHRLSDVRSYEAGRFYRPYPDWIGRKMSLYCGVLSHLPLRVMVPASFLPVDRPTDIRPYSSCDYECPVSHRAGHFFCGTNPRARKT